MDGDDEFTDAEKSLLQRALTQPEWPKVGERYVWEMASPGAACGVIVTAVEWNGEEWWVKSRKLNGIWPYGEEIPNELERFQEACLPYRRMTSARMKALLSPKWEEYFGIAPSEAT